MGVERREGEDWVCAAAENLWPGISSTKSLSPVEFLKAGSLRILLLPLPLTFFILIGKICSSSIKVKKNWSFFAICC